MSGSDEWLFGGVHALSWSLGSLSRSLAGLALFVLGMALASLGVAAGNLLASGGAALALAYAVVVVTIQARDYYHEAETRLPGVLREGLERVPVIFGIVLLCCYALFVLTVLGGAFLIFGAMGVLVFGPDLMALALLPLAVHLLARLAVAVPVAVVDGVGPLRALERGMDVAPAMLPRLFGLLTALSIAALPVAAAELVFQDVPGIVLAFVAGGLSALGVTALTRVYLDAQDSGRDDKLPHSRRANRSPRER